MNVNEFECSITATDHMYKLQHMLNNPRVRNWCKATDDNFLGSPDCVTQLNKARAAFDKLVEILEHAE